MFRLLFSFVFFLLIEGASTASAQFLLVPESDDDDVMLLDAGTGALVDPTYIDLTPVGGATPFEALEVGSEIWVSDNTADAIFRFSLSGATFLSSITGGLDGIRGMAFLDGVVYVVNTGTANGAPGSAIVRFSMAGANLGSFPVPLLYDLMPFQGDLLATESAGDSIQRWSTSGAFLGTFHDSDGVTGIDSPQQLAYQLSGRVLAGGFSAPSGIYQYDATTGAELDYAPIGPVRGVYNIANGNYVTTDDFGVWIYDILTGSESPVVLGEAAGLISAFSGGTPPVMVLCPGDGSGAACPCGNSSLPGSGEGCANSLGLGGKLTAGGTPSIANDTLVLHGEQMPSSAALYFMGTNALNVPFGDGLRCAAGATVRLGTKTNIGGASQYPAPGDPSITTAGLLDAPSFRVVQCWYRNAATFCTSATFNLTNGLGIHWKP